MDELADVDRLLAYLRRCYPRGRWDVEELHGWTSMSLRRAENPPEGVRLLRALPKLERLDVSGDYRDRDLRELGALERIRHLRLDGRKVTAALFREAFRSWRRLELLELGNVRLRGDAFSGLAGCRKLETVRLWNCKLDADAVASLASLDGLRVLSAGTTELTAAAAATLGACAGLERLELSPYTRLGDADLEQLVAAVGLCHLSFGASRLTDRGASAIAKLPRLRTLRLVAPVRVSDDGLTRIASVPSLRELHVGGAKRARGRFFSALPRKLTTLEVSSSAVDDTHLSELAHLHELERLSLARTRVTDDGMASLAKLAGLGALDLQQTKVTARGLAQLGLALLERTEAEEQIKSEALRAVRQTHSSGPRDCLVHHVVGTVGHAHFDEVVTFGDVGEMAAFLREAYEREAEDLDLLPGLREQLLVFLDGRLAHRIDLQRHVRIHRVRRDETLGRGLVYAKVLENEARREKLHARLRGGERMMLRLRLDGLPLSAPLANPLARGEELAVRDFRAWEDADEEEVPLLLRVTERGSCGGVTST